MPTYYVGEEDDEHLVDHPPLFACRAHKKMLRLNTRFVAELISVGMDMMPGNPQEIVGSYLRAAENAYKLPEFLLPPKLILFNPRNLREAEALPYATVLVDKRFYGIPARYLTPDRFDGCEECQKRRRRRPGSGGPRRPSGRIPPRPGTGDVKRPPGTGDVKRPPGTGDAKRPPVGGDPSDSGRRRTGSASDRRPPPGSGRRRPSGPPSP